MGVVGARPYRSGGCGVAAGPGAATEAECWASFASLALTGVDADIVRTVVEGSHDHRVELIADTVGIRAGRRGSSAIAEGSSL